MIKTHRLKKEARKLIDQLPENASWEDLMYKLYVRTKIEHALDQAKNGPWFTTEQVRRSILKK